MKIQFISILFLVCLFSCKESSVEIKVAHDDSYFFSSEEGVRDGGVQMIPVETAKGKFNVWTKRIGNNPNIKVLLLHGGPGCTHEYFECFESFFPGAGIEFIYYDQLDCGHSEHPGDTSLYDLPTFVEEVEQVRKALKLDESNFYLYGHSWGGILAMQYALKYQQNLKGLIISNMMASCPEYDKYASEVLAKQMPSTVVDSIFQFEKNGKFQDPTYLKLLNDHFYNDHICRLKEWPEPLTRMFSHLNSEMYVMMQGPSEFGISGKLENWDVSKELKQIQVPTLVIGATHDTMDPAYMEWMSHEFQNGQFLLCSNGSHCCFFDDQDTYFKGLIAFLNGQ